MKRNQSHVANIKMAEMAFYLKMSKFVTFFKNNFLSLYYFSYYSLLLLFVILLVFLSLWFNQSQNSITLD